MAACPKCGNDTETNAVVCPTCGVIIAKFRARGASAALPPPPETAPGEATSKPRIMLSAPEREHMSAVDAFLRVTLALVAVFLAFMVFNRLPKHSSSEPPPPTLAATGGMKPAPPVQRLEERENGDPNALKREEIVFINGLVSRLKEGSHEPVTDAELFEVERIFTIHGGNAQLREVLVGIYLRRASTQLQTRAFPQAERTLTRLKEFGDIGPQLYDFEANLKASEGDWTSTEAAIRRFEGVSDPTINLSYMLALSLDHLGRKADAQQVLDRPVFKPCPTITLYPDVTACQFATQMRAAFAAANNAVGPGAAERPRAALQLDGSKQLIQSDRFDVRFDGASQTGVARDVLFVLDRAYVRLADKYYTRPTRKIPVVLHSEQGYYLATGAPWWSGGEFSSHTGAIQVPIRGIPSTLPKEMEDVFVHELSHAFVDEMSGGQAGHIVQEGLAQYMEGKRVETEVTPAQLKALVFSSGRDVRSFYLLSLAIMEELVQSRGQVNDLLLAMKETGSEDGGFKKILGAKFTAVQEEILHTLQKRYS